MASTVTGVSAPESNFDDDAAETPVPAQKPNVHVNDDASAPSPFDEHGYPRWRAFIYAGAVVAVVIAVVVAVLLTGGPAAKPTTVQVEIPFKFCSPVLACQQPWADETLRISDGGSQVFDQRVNTLHRHANGYQITLKLVPGHSYQAELFFSLAGKPYRSETVVLAPQAGQGRLVFADGATPVR